MKEIQIERIDGGEFEKRNIDTWGIWEKEPSEFDWAYTNEEHCFIIEGKAEIDTGVKRIEIKKGDYVVFPVGLKCRWKISEGIKKYYEFR
jgi:uncharacterized cupin superfamily protein